MSLLPSPADDRRVAVPRRGPLARGRRSEAAQQAFVGSLFDAAAPDYERIESLVSLGSGRWYRRRALQRAGLREGAQVLDVGVGTGLVAREARCLIGARGRLVGVDPSPGMMSQVRVPGIRLLQGRAEALPVADASADFVSMGYALRYLADVRAAFAEFRRVLRPGGRLLVLEITRPASRLASLLLEIHLRLALPALARCLAQRSRGAELLRNCWDTMDAGMAPPRVMQALHDAGFREVRRDVELGIFSEYTATRCA